MVHDKSNKGSLQNYLIYFIALLASCLLTWVSILQYPVFNTDGVLYLQAAKSFLQGGIKAAYYQYSWPFYSILIANVARLFGLSLITAGYLLSAVFFAIITLSFIGITRALSFSPKRQWFSLLVILSFRPLSKFSHQILRDSGYLAFFLLSVVLFMAFVKKPSWRLAILWNVSLAVAALFRVEGVIYLVLVPGLLFIGTQQGWRKILWQYLQVNALTILYIILIGSFLFYVAHGNVQDLGRLRELLVSIVGVLQMTHQYFIVARDLVGHSILPSPAAQFATVLMSSGLLGVFVYCLLVSITLPYLIGAAYAVRVGGSIKWNKYNVILTYLIISLVLVFSYSMRGYYFVERYFLSVDLLLLLIAIVGLADLYTNRHLDKQRVFPWRKVMLVIAIIAVVAQMISTLFHIGPSKKYIYDVAMWVKTHTARDAFIYTNDGKIAFISARKSIGWQCNNLVNYTNKETCFNWKTPLPQQWKQANYLVLSIDNKTQLKQMNALVQQQPIKRFIGRDGKGAVVYQFSQ